MRLLFTVFLSYIVVNCYTQEVYRVLKDTTDSNSIVLKTQKIAEIQVTSKQALFNLKSGIGGVSIDVNELKKLPNIMGDADPFKSLQYLGGISQAGEASANMSVRGGNNDQNLILLNGCTIQNPTHVLGLFSVFNPDLIDQMKFIKFGIPAEYGSKLSSVIDIKSFTNQPEKVEIAGNTGLIASRLSVKLPIGKKLSLYASQRNSYLGAVVIPTLVKLGIDPKLAQNNFEFFDTNVGFNYHINTKTMLSGHYYSGKDMIEISENAKFSIEDNTSEWGNKVWGVQLKHLFSDRLSMTHFVNSTNFYINSGINWLTEFYRLNSINSSLNYKSEFIFVANHHNLKMGAEIAETKILPIRIDKTVTENAQAINPPTYNNSSLAAMYVRDEWEYKNLLLNVGVRANLYFQHPQSAISYPLNLNDKHSVLQSYYGIEPRLLSRWLFPNESSVKLAISKHFQYSNQVQVLNLGLPLSVFVLPDNNIKPTSLWHLSAGYFKSFSEKNWELSIESYYKSFSNLLEFGGKLTDLMSSDKINESLYSGIGWAYGAELQIRKNSGKFNGWLTYTLGWNYRKFDAINNAKPYLATNDRRHDLALVGFYNINSKLAISGTFVFATGSRLNLPRSWYIIDDNVVLEFSKYNSFKLPDYNRLDISLTYKLPKYKLLNSELNFSVYNVYNRANPFQVYYSTSTENGSYDYKIKMSYLTPILPSISWTFHL